MSNSSLQPVLFEDEQPPMIFPDDSPRVRLSDPITSHMAADSSVKTLSTVRLNVLRLVRERGPLVGSELNAGYAESASLGRFERVGWDSPRKRAGELAGMGLLARREPRRGLNADLETEYELTILGLEMLEVSK